MSNNKKKLDGLINTIISHFKILVTGSSHIQRDLDVPLSSVAKKMGVSALADFWSNPLPSDSGTQDVNFICQLYIYFNYPIIKCVKQ